MRRGEQGCELELSCSRSLLCHTTHAQLTGIVRGIERALEIRRATKKDVAIDVVSLAISAELALPAGEGLRVACV